jgi:hypothetical protein
VNLCGKEDEEKKKKKKKKKKKLMPMEEEEDCLWSSIAIFAAFGHPCVCACRRLLYP